MRPVSATFLNALDGSATYTARARVIDPYQRDAGGNFLAIGPAVPILDGSVTLDGTADHRTRVDGLSVAPTWPDVGQDTQTAGTGQRAFAALYNFPGKEVWPSPSPTTFPRGYAWNRRLSPHGNLLRIESGVELGNGSVEYVQVATVRIDAVRQDDAPYGPIDVDCSDIGVILDDAGLDYDKTFPAGTTMATIFAALTSGYNDPLHYRVGIMWSQSQWDLDLDPTFAASTITAPASTDGDRPGFMRELASTRGYEVWWDARPKLVVRPKLANSAAPPASVWDIDAGPTGIASRIGREMTRDGVYTVVVAEGDAASAAPPVKAVQYNQGDDFAYWAYFGAVLLKSASSFYVTQAQVESGARSILDSQAGVPYRINAEHVTNPALEPRDAVNVWIYGREDPLNFTQHIVQSTTIPLIGGTQSTVMREVGL